MSFELRVVPTETPQPSRGFAVFRVRFSPIRTGFIPDRQTLRLRHLRQMLVEPCAFASTPIFCIRIVGWRVARVPRG